MQVPYFFPLINIRFIIGYWYPLQSLGQHLIHIPHTLLLVIHEKNNYINMGNTITVLLELILIMEDRHVN